MDTWTSLTDLRGEGVAGLEEISQRACIISDHSVVKVRGDGWVGQQGIGNICNNINNKNNNNYYFCHCFEKMQYNNFSILRAQSGGTTGLDSATYPCLCASFTLCIK